ncbi:MAG: septum formation protein Maf [Clostridia bacterium]|nr:septum formation protein Maf [Clostridia bacterium]
MIERVVLASASPRRKEILETLKIPFEVLVSDAEESAETEMPAGEYAAHLAREKCRNAAKKLEARGEDISRTLIIGCDTVVCYDGMVIGKPPDDLHAALTLGVLSDSWHSVYSGLALRVGGTLASDFARTDVKFRELTEAEIMRYVASGEPRGKAGSYAIQLYGASFAERIEGDFYNIVGFPVALFTSMLKSVFGTEIFEISEI